MKENLRIKNRIKVVCREAKWLVIMLSPVFSIHNLRAYMVKEKKKDFQRKGQGVYALV